MNQTIRVGTSTARYNNKQLNRLVTLVGITTLAPNWRRNTLLKIFLFYFYCFRSYLSYFVDVFLFERNSCETTTIPPQTLAFQSCTSSNDDVETIRLFNHSKRATVIPYFTHINNTNLVKTFFVSWRYLFKCIFDNNFVRYTFSPAYLYENNF